ncbi:MAG: TatD family hydrolase [Hyphomicrobiaceae bacterium]
MLVDHHCHLDFPQFSDDLDGVVARAKAAGVGTMVTISTKVREFDKIRTIAERFEDVYCSVGTHPHYADQERGIPACDIVALAEHPKVIAVGEAGLDYHYQKSEAAAQAEGFREHIKAARQTGLPLEIHARDADEDTLEILKKAHKEDGPFPAVLHCYTGGRELAMRAMDLGLYISFSGVVTFKNSQALRNLAGEVPLERILVETDAPYLAPVPYRGKTNEPSYVVNTAAVVAEVRGMTPDALANATTQNFFRYYTKAKPPKLTSTISSGLATPATGTTQAS